MTDKYLNYRLYAILSIYTYLADGTKYKVMGGNDELGGNSFSSGRVYLGPLTYRQYDPKTGR